jgi:hypothetical protein
VTKIPKTSYFYSIVGIAIKKLVHIAGLQMNPPLQNLNSKYIVRITLFDGIEKMIKKILKFEKIDTKKRFLRKFKD